MRKVVLCIVMWVALMANAGIAGEVALNGDVVLIKTAVYNSKEYVMIYMGPSEFNIYNDYFCFEIDGTAKKDYWMSLLLNNVQNKTGTTIRVLLESTEPLLYGPVPSGPGTSGPIIRWYNVVNIGLY